MKKNNIIISCMLPQHPDCCSYAGAGILVVGTSEGEVMFVDLDCKQHVFSWTNKQLKYPGFITGTLFFPLFHPLSVFFPIFPSSSLSLFVFSPFFHNHSLFFTLFSYFSIPLSLFHLPS